MAVCSLNSALQLVGEQLVGFDDNAISLFKMLFKLFFAVLFKYHQYPHYQQKQINTSQVGLAVNLFTEPVPNGCSNKHKRYGDKQIF